MMKRAYQVIGASSGKWPDYQTCASRIDFSVSHLWRAGLILKLRLPVDPATHRDVMVICPIIDQRELIPFGKIDRTLTEATNLQVYSPRRRVCSDTGFWLRQRAQHEGAQPDTNRSDHDGFEPGRRLPVTRKVVMDYRRHPRDEQRRRAPEKRYHHGKHEERDRGQHVISKGVLRVAQMMNREAGRRCKNKQHEATKKTPQEHYPAQPKQGERNDQRFKPRQNKHHNKSFAINRQWLVRTRMTTFFGGGVILHDPHILIQPRLYQRFAQFSFLSRRS